MTRLSISLLGPLQVAVDGQAVTRFEYNKVRALLAYLAVEADRAHHREVLAELLWPERPAKTSRSNLRKTLSTLRRALRDDDSAQPLLIATRETVQFNTASDHWLDVSEFVQCVQSQNLRRAAELYRGPFLDQFLPGDCLAFEHWQLNQRQWLHRQALQTLETLAGRCEASQELEQAASYAQRQVELEPWHEDAHRRLMRLYFRLGRRGTALAQYETCRRALAEGLGVEPTEQTLSLYESLCLEEPPASQPSAVIPHNPYTARAILKDPSAFVGRADELHDLFTLLAAMQNCSIVGPRRIGKSSLLYYLTHPAVYSARLPDPARYVIAFMDLQELAGAGQDEFFYTAVQRLRRAGRVGGGELGSGELGNWGIREWGYGALGWSV